MTVHFVSAPNGGEQLVRTGLARIVARGINAPSHLRQINLNSIKIQEGHAIYDLGLDAVRSGASLAAARRSAVRYLVNDANKPVVAAEVPIDGNQRATLLTNLNSGPFVASSAQALLNIQERHEVEAGSFEACLLRISAIAVMAVWLKSETSAPDFLYPIAPTPAFLKLGRLYSASDFLASVRPAAFALIAASSPKSTP